MLTQYFKFIQYIFATNIGRGLKPKETSLGHSYEYVARDSKRVSELVPVFMQLDNEKSLGSCSIDLLRILILPVVIVIISDGDKVVFVKYK
jgi:hypothetical protein